jgi:AraC-like DNA-binding protein
MLHEPPEHWAPATPMPLGWIGHTAKLAAGEGVDVLPAVAQASLGPGGRFSERSPVGAAEYLLMCVLIINGMDDEMHGVTRGRMSRGTANLMVQAAASSPRLAGAIASFQRFFEIAGAFCRIELQQDEHEAHILIRSESGDARAQQLVEEMVGTFLHIQLSAYLDFFLPLSRFSTTAPDHPLTGQTHAYFLCPVVRRNTTALSFPASYLHFSGKPRSMQNPLLEGELTWLSLHNEAAYGWFNRAHADSLSAAVFRKLRERLLGFEACGQALRLTPAQLRHGLWREGTSFRRLRRAALLERARAHLSEGAGAEALAEVLDYSDARSFRRALKLATGLSISDLRGQLAPPGAGPPAVIERLKAEKLRQL